MSTFGMTGGTSDTSGDFKKWAKIVCISLLNGISLWISDVEIQGDIVWYILGFVRFHVNEMNF